jgi:DNA-binding SARP family transcriptional activator/tetratricopeptide (TPR) repeat protein
MKFVLLGSVEGWAEGRQVDLGTARQRCVLAALLVTPGRPVPLDVLVDRVWGAESPPAVRSTLYSYIARLRRILQTNGCALKKRAGGYQVSTPDDAVDLWQWDALLNKAKTASEGDRLSLLGQALDLWQGRPLDDLDGQWVVQVRDAVQQQFLEALAEWAELTTDAGHPNEAANRLAAPVLASPLVEPLVAARMRALHAVGRTAEALECFARTRQHTTSELGVEPSAALRALHQEILQSESELGVVAPAQLPAAVTDFVGRRAAIQRLNDLLSADSVVIIAIAGTAGVGKTALAVHWAHRVAKEFPDGQLYLNFNGYSSAPRVDAARALELTLHTLGVPGEKIPPDAESRAGIYRSMLAGKRMLVVLDNVDSAGQVRPLLPGQPGCLVLVTSRDRLNGLVATDGARRIDLDVLSTEEARALLIRLLGDRVNASPRATDELIALCARLPLALRIAAANLGPHSVAGYVAALAGNRLAHLAIADDPQAIVSTQLDYSYQRLGSVDRQLFRLLGCLPGADVSTAGAAALIESTVDAAGRLLTRLADAHLVEQHQPDRYTCHDLLRIYAASRAGAEETDAALHRLFGWYLDMSMGAMEQIDPDRRKLLPPPEDLVLRGYDEAMKWLETERPTLVAVTSLAASLGWHSYAWELPHVLWRYFFIRGHLEDWHVTHEFALTAARELGDPMAEAETLTNLGTAHRRAGRFPQALDHHLRALDLYRLIGDEVGEASALANIGIAHQRLGQYPEALDHFGQVLLLQERLGDTREQARALGNLGVIYEELGRYPESLTHYIPALTKFQQINDRHGEAIALANIGIVHQRLGQYSQALAHQRRALALHQSLGDRQGEAAVLANLGYTHCRLGRTHEAFAHQHQALTLARQIGDTDLESEIHNDLGETHATANEHAAALTEFRHALTMAIDTGSRHQEARAHRGIARAHHEKGQHYTAKNHWQAALNLYTTLGIAEAANLGTELATLDPQCQPTPNPHS